MFLASLLLATVKNNKEILGLINFKSNCRIFSDLAKNFPMEFTKCLFAV